MAQRPVLKLQHIRMSFGYSQTRTRVGAEGGESEDAAGIRAVGEEGELETRQQL